MNWLRALAAPSALALVAAASIVLTPPASAQPCTPAWSDQFGGGAIDGLLRCSLVADLGEGPRLFVGGAFGRAGGFDSRGVVAFDGHKFIPLAEGLVDAVTIYSLAAGPEAGKSVLYAGGHFNSGPDHWYSVMRWDGLAWTEVGERFNGNIRGLTFFDDGSGPALYAAGQFDEVGGQSAGGLARWDGAAWSVGAGGLSGSGYAMTVWDDGRGPALYVGGEFGRAGEVDASSVARWDGQAWEPLGTGVGGGERYVLALRAWDDGTGERLYVGGKFGSAGGIPANDVAVWDGAAWSAMGDGLGNGANQYVSSLVVASDDQGEHLYAGGTYYGLAPDFNTGGLARWNGLAWDGGGMENHVAFVRTLAIFDGAMYIGGEFSDHMVRRTARFLDQVGNGFAGGAVNALAVANVGDGPRLFAVGEFDYAGGTANTVDGDFDHGIATWDGGRWRSLSHGIGEGGSGFAAIPFFDGVESTLAVGGDLKGPDDEQTDPVDRWNGSRWMGIPGGPGGHGGGDRVNVLTVYDDGHGADLYAAGAFTHADDLWCRRIARWDGKAWSPLGSGLEGDGTPEVYALQVFDDGSGPALFVTGDFSIAGGYAAANIAKWNGHFWTWLGEGLDGPGRALCVFDDGTGPALYVGGDFTTAGGQPAAHIARWDGKAWSPLGEGTTGYVRALATFDDGSQPGLYVGGSFGTAGGQPASCLARFDGAGWSGVGLEVSGGVHALRPARENGHGVLWVGGFFQTAGGVSSANIAKLEGCACYADMDTSRSLDLFDFLAFLNAFNAAGSAADCDSSGSLDLFDFLCFVNAFNAGC